MFHRITELCPPPNASFKFIFIVLQILKIVLFYRAETLVADLSPGVVIGMKVRSRSC